MSSALETPPELDSFGARLRWIRLLRGYNQASKLAKAIGRDPRTLYRYEQNLKTPKAATLQALCEVLEVDDIWLAYGRGEPFRRGEDGPPAPPGVEAYLSSREGADVSPDVAKALRAMPFALLGVPNPDVLEVGRVRVMVEMCRADAAQRRHAEDDSA